MNDIPRSEEVSVSVSELMSLAPPELGLNLVTGSSDISGRKITSDRLQKFGLAVSGATDRIRSGRIQMIGGFETAYFDRLSGKERTDLLNTLDAGKIPCIVITKGIKPFNELLEFAGRHSIPLLTTPEVSSKVTGILTDILTERLATEIALHGVLLEIDGVGVFITGESGIGKSECALDLVSRGHRLVSDDSVRVRRIGKRLTGSSPEVTFEYLEIRGLGIVNVRELFGISSVCESMSIDLCIELRKWEDAGTIDRIGSNPLEEDILGIKRPKFIFPVRPGRNLSNLTETAVKIFLARKAGNNAAEQLVEKQALLVSGS